jgi:hypothetical protein
MLSALMPGRFLCWVGMLPQLQVGITAVSVQHAQADPRNRSMSELVLRGGGERRKVTSRPEKANGPETSPGSEPSEQPQARRSPPSRSIYQKRARGQQMIAFSLSWFRGLDSGTGSTSVQIPRRPRLSV